MSRPGRVPPTSARTIRALFLVPDPDQPGLTEPERLALRLRRDATIAGRCACGAVAPPVRIVRGHVIVVAIEHESDCPVGDGPVHDRIARRLGARLAYQAVVAEVRVA